MKIYLCFSRVLKQVRNTFKYNLQLIYFFMTLTMNDSKYMISCLLYFLIALICYWFNLQISGNLIQLFGAIDHGIQLSVSSTHSSWYSNHFGMCRILQGQTGASVSNSMLHQLTGIQRCLSDAFSKLKQGETGKKINCFLHQNFKFKMVLTSGVIDVG